MGRMARGAMPQVRLHRAGGQGCARLAGRVVDVGRFGTPDANARSMELMIEHGFVPAPATAPRDAAPQVPPASEPVILPAGDEPLPAGLTVGEICTMYL